jgi:hypothetical protein
LIRDFGYRRAADRPRNNTAGTTDGGGAADWAYLADNIRAGRALHDSTRDLIAKLIASGMDKGAVVNLLRGLMEKSDAPHDARWQARYDDIPRLVESAEPAAAGDLPLTFFDQLLEDPPRKAWLIKGVMARDEISSWIGPPGTGKSALLGDIAVHRAAGRNWRGYVTKDKFGAIIFAMERGDLTKRRLTAYKLRDDLVMLPIAVASRVINLMDRGCVETIWAAIDNAQQHFGHAVDLIAFDTYAKGIAAGGGDENKARDQTMVQANMRRLFDKGWHGHIATVGHTGKDPNRGERGSNARLADIDVEVQITGNAIKTATVTKANDQALGPLTSFRLEPFDFGPEEDGSPFQTFILAREIITDVQGKRAGPLSPRRALAVRALADIVNKQGDDPPAEYQLPRGVKIISADAWRKECIRCGALDADATNPPARFAELRRGLAARFVIGSRDDKVWLIRPTNP